MESVWKEIPSLLGYEASNCGLIRNALTGKILKAQLNREGYFGIKIRGKTRRVHRLIAEAFLGSSDKTVDHINGVKTDNKIENLRYLTAIENSRAYAFRNGRMVGSTYVKKVNKWRAFFNSKSLGYFDTQQEAHNAYMKSLSKFQRVYGNAALMETRCYGA